MAASVLKEYLPARSIEHLAIFGAVAASYVGLKILLSVLRGLKAFVLGPALGLSKNLKKTGEWAVVTGSTDGIGKAYAEELAKKGMNIVLISRNPDKLRDVAQEIESKSKVKTKCVAIDFTGGPEIYETIKQEISQLDIGVLVNNVGMGFGHPEFFAEIADKEIQNVINVNVTSLTMMTKVVLPGMVERKKGVVINISSGSGFKATPLLNVYSATKAYVDFFSQCLETEYRSKGITVQCVMPFFVATKLSKIKRESFFVPGPTTYVRSALATVGIEGTTFGCLSHALQAYVMDCLPSGLLKSVTIGQMLAVRKKALKRAAAKKD